MPSQPFGEHEFVSDKHGWERSPMKPGLAIGHRYEYTVTVTDEMRARLGEVDVHPLYGTASMISQMEWASRQHILPYLEPGEEGVGWHVDIKHLAPAPIGAEIRIVSEVMATEPERVTSRVEAWHGKTKVGEGSLTQALVSREQLYERAGIDPDIPEPARINAKDDAFALEILKWETGQFPCTRYDEWLICRVILNGEQAEGPFLLRHEIEEWIHACQVLADGQRTLFQSDFLEPVLTVELTATEPGEFDCKLSLSPPDKGDRNYTVLSLAKSDLAAFARQLEAQLAGFPSKL